MNKNHTLNISIGAALAGGFASAFKQSSHQLTQLGSSIKKLEQQSKEVDRFRTLQKATQKTSNQLAEAEQSVHALRLAIQQTDKPSKQLLTHFGKAKAAANKAREALKKKRVELNQMRKSLDLTAMSSNALTQRQRTLGASTEQLRRHYGKLQQTMQKHEQILGKRSALRSQAFDMIALGTAIGAPIKTAVDFESAMADVKKVLNVPEDKERADQVVGALEKRLKQMSRQIPITAQGLAQIAASGAQLGVGNEVGTDGERLTNLDTLSNFVETTAKMATAFDMNEAEAGDAIGKLSNVFGIGVEHMASFGDAINHLSDNTAAKASDIVSALLRVGGPAGDFGLKPESVAALAGSFLALGKPPQVAGTAINALLVKLNTAEKQGEKFQRGLAALGWEASELKTAIGDDAEGALLSFLETVSQVEQQDRAGILFDLFGQEYVDDISLLAGKIEVYKGTLSVLSDEAKKNGSMQREFMNRSQTTANQMVLFKNAATELGITLGSSLLPAINNVLKQVSTITLGIATLSERFSLLSKIIFGTVFSLIALKVAAIGVSFVWTFVTGGAALVMGALAKMRIQLLLSQIGFHRLSVAALLTASRLKILAIGSMIAHFAKGLFLLARRAIPIAIGGLRALTVAFMTNPIGLIIGGIALAAGLLITHWDKVKSFFLTLWKPIEPVWKAFAAFIGHIWDIISKPLQAIGALWDQWFGRDTKMEANITEVSEAHSSLANTMADMPIKEAASPTNHTHHHQQDITIHVHGQAGQNVHDIADAVMKRLASRKRGALFDQVAESY